MVRQSGAVDFSSISPRRIVAFGLKDGQTDGFDVHMAAMFRVASAHSAADRAFQCLRRSPTR
jgi:hypothetical protein